ncbi:hypothetical protein ACIXHL_23015 [Bacteroides fragilis]
MPPLPSSRGSAPTSKAKAALRRWGYRLPVPPSVEFGGCYGSTLHVPLARLSVALCFGARQAALRLFLRPWGSALGSVGSCRFCSRVRLIFGCCRGAL